MKHLDTLIDSMKNMDLVRTIRKGRYKYNRNYQGLSRQLITLPLQDASLLRMEDPL